jgi:hypothetical protein
MRYIGLKLGRRTLDRLIPMQGLDSVGWRLTFDKPHEEFVDQDKGERGPASDDGAYGAVGNALGDVG